MGKIVFSKGPDQDETVRRDLGGFLERTSFTLWPAAIGVPSIGKLLTYFDRLPDRMHAIQRFQHDIKFSYKKVQSNVL